MSIDKASQSNVAVAEVRGTKRKRSEVSRTKDGKYQCNEFDYESSQSSHLRTHEESKHEGI